ncbi:MAG: hypothetical protein AAF543_08870 [Pseudomonadota bacterium]
MTSSRPLPHAARSRRRFLTFGGALILAACLTTLKMTLLALDATDQGVTAWSDRDDQPRSITPPSPPGTLDEARFTPWPTQLPEPAAGPADQGSRPEPPGESTITFDPSTLTEGQIKALQQLAARRQELDERERLLDMRAELNGRTEERLDQQISRLTELKERIEALMAGLDEAEEQKLARLVKIYETMKPKAAAEIFNRLEIPILLHVVERMKEAKSAVVLGKMNPAIAKRVTSELAKRKERPSPDDQGLGS